METDQDCAGHKLCFALLTICRDRRLSGSDVLSTSSLNATVWNVANVSSVSNQYNSGSYPKRRWSAGVSSRQEKSCRALISERIPVSSESACTWRSLLCRASCLPSAGAGDVGWVSAVSLPTLWIAADAPANCEQPHCVSVCVFDLGFFDIGVELELFDSSYVVFL